MHRTRAEGSNLRTYARVVNLKLKNFLLDFCGDCGLKRSVRDQRGDRVDVGRRRTIDRSSARHDRAHARVHAREQRRRRRAARADRSPGTRTGSRRRRRASRASSARSRLERRAHAHAHVVLAVGRGRDGVDAGRMRECLDLGRQRRGGHLRHHVAGLQPAVGGQERRQVAERRIDEPIGAPLADRRELRERDARSCRRRSPPARRESCRPTRSRRRRRRPSGCRWRRWLRSRAACAANASASRAAPWTCARAAQRVGVLHAPAVLVRPVDGAAGEQRADVGGRVHLAGVRPRRVDARVERVDRAAQRIDRQRGRDVGRARQPLGAGERQRRDRRRRLRAVDEREPFLWVRASTGVEPGRRERVAPRQQRRRRRRPTPRLRR